jgi:hypothetical protein
VASAAKKAAPTPIVLVALPANDDTIDVDKIKKP